MEEREAQMNREAQREEKEPIRSFPQGLKLRPWTDSPGLADGVDGKLLSASPLLPRRQCWAVSSVSTSSIFIGFLHSIQILHSVPSLSTSQCRTSLPDTAGLCTIYTVTCSCPSAFFWRPLDGRYSSSGSEAIPTGRRDDIQKSNNPASS